MESKLLYVVGALDSFMFASGACKRRRRLFFSHWKPKWKVNLVKSRLNADQGVLIMFGDLIYSVSQGELVSGTD